MGLKMNKIKQSIIIIIVILLFINGLLLQAGLAARLTVFRSGFYHDLVKETTISAAIHQSLQDSVYREASAILPQELATIMGNIFAAVFDHHWVEEQLMLVVSDYLDYYRGRQDSPQAVIDLRPKRKELRGNLEQALELVPPAAFAYFGFDQANSSAIATAIVDKLPLPDTLSVEELLSKHEGGPQLQRFIENARQYRFFYTYLPFILFLLFYFILKRISGASGSFKYIGGVILAAGVIFSVTLQMVRTYYLRNLAAYIAPESDVLEAGLILLFRRVVDFGASLSLYFAVIGVSIMLIGGIMGWIQMFRRPKKS